MKRSIPFLLVVVLGVMLSATAVIAEEEPPALPEHPHMLVLGVEFDATGFPIAYKKCVDLADNRKLPLIAQHNHMHFGQAGIALDGAGHVVVPGAPLTEWADCDELIEFFFPEG